MGEGVGVFRPFERSLLGFPLGRRLIPNEIPLEIPLVDEGQEVLSGRIDALIPGRQVVDAPNAIREHANKIIIIMRGVFISA